ncbi:MAG: SHIRT domain-containing protein [Eubacteriales bacterium]
MPITVTLDPVTMSTPSQVVFRVFVEDDTPPSYAVSYSFMGATPGHALPTGVLAQQPGNTTALSGTTISPDASFSAVRDGVGEWTFSGWSPASDTVNSSDLSFSGSWVWTALPVYTVEYRFVSDSGKYPLPSGVLAKLPASASGIAGDVFSASYSFESVRMHGGVWRFSGWNPHTQTIWGENIVFTGTWHWHMYPDEPSGATPSPSPDVASAALQTQQPQQPSPVPTAKPAPVEASIQVLEQVYDSAPPAAAAAASGGGVPVSPAAVALATALAVLVASQAFAVASDLKVLKWYNAKKAARRTRI